MKSPRLTVHLMRFCLAAAFFAASMTLIAEPVPTPASRNAQQAVDGALTFLQKDAVKWREERGCATCHHGTMTVWALSEAKSQGYQVSAESLVVLEAIKIVATVEPHDGGRDGSVDQRPVRPALPRTYQLRCAFLHRPDYAHLEPSNSNLSEENRRLLLMPRGGNSVINYTYPETPDGALMMSVIENNPFEHVRRGFVVSSPINWLLLRNNAIHLNQPDAPTIVDETRLSGRAEGARELLHLEGSK